MFKKITALFLALVLTGCASSPASGSTQSQTDQTDTVVITKDVQEIIDRGYLIVACKDDVPGFGFYNEETQEYEGMEIGLAYQIASKIFDVSYNEAVEEKLVHFVPVAVDDREKVLQQHEVDYVIATYTITNERKEKVNFSKSYYSSSVGLMVNITKIGENTLKEERIRSIIDLDNKIIGVMSNSTTRRDFLDYIQKHNINISPRFVTYKSYEQLAKALDNGDIDVFCVDVTILTGYLDENKKILDDRFATQHYGIASPKDKEGLNEIANIVVSEMD
jgi:putative glutamine transport system substrate-binding protein